MKMVETDCGDGCASSVQYSLACGEALPGPAPGSEPSLGKNGSFLAISVKINVISVC